MRAAIISSRWRPPSGRCTYYARRAALSTHLQQLLDGAPLPKPRLARVRWEKQQKFEVADDPDRAAQEHDWGLPGFIAAVDPAARAQQTTAEDIDVSHVKNCVPGFSFARVVDGVLRESECTEILRSLNTKGFTPALVNIGHGYQQYLPEYRNSYRVVQDSPPLADWLLEVLRPHLPQTMSGAHSQWRVPATLTLSEVNARCRFLCYVPGQDFKPHKDGGEMRRARGARSANTARDLSLITIQLYLHDMPPQIGGATRFLVPAADRTRHPDVSYQPRAGSVLLFTQELMHEGAVVSAGRKFAMRSEVMYAGHHIPA
jgi:prolyl 4-hydroxylase